MNIRPPLLLCAVALASCSSPPVNFYTLSSPMLPETTSSINIIPFELRPVRVPLQVDQPQLVLNTSNTTLAVRENDRWGAPLADEFHDALMQRLEQGFNSRNLSGLPKPSSTEVLRVQVTLRRFESAPTQHAAIDAVWNLALSRQQETSRSLTCSSRIIMPAGETLSALVQAHQQALDELAKVLTRTGSAWYVNEHTSCPPSRPA